ncbi:MAG: exo-alpha-sialidase, partial [Sedimentisphaerales bacterium]|nr:exo-alpha-sialidase [Sedimentisphaerales bacterium]
MKCLFMSILLVLAAGGSDEPVRYVGPDKVSNSDYRDGYHDGQMRPAVGTHNYQILRANRTHPEWSDGLGWTYNHAPMLAYVNGQFYCQYLTNPFGEHIPPGLTMLVRSKDGVNWTMPQVLFPIYITYDPNAWVVYHFMHQRMGFYVAPNGRFLTMGFYGPPDGDGIGRVVREIYPDDSLGPIYFIRVNDNWTGQVNFPLYTESRDEGFVEACEAFLADPVRRMQWWEEDRFCKDKDEFYRVPWIDDRGQKVPGKAFCFYRRDDGVIVGFFKDRWVTTSADGGLTWSKPVRCNSLTYGGAKIWAQRLDNGQYALVYNPTDSAARHPVCVATSDDGIDFDGLAVVHGEVPPKRFWGREKRPGPQYVRGIVEGNGNPPGDDLWVVYSVNKEDIWISRIPVPVRREVKGPVHDDFTSMPLGRYVKDWNIYSPKWCPIEIVQVPGQDRKALRLMDYDPYDYAKAVRVFQRASRHQISFGLRAERPAEPLDIEVLAAKGQRLISIRIDRDCSVLVGRPDGSYSRITGLAKASCARFTISSDADSGRFRLALDANDVTYEGDLCQDGEPERIEFRTGPYRLADDVQKYKSGSEDKPGWDEPGADEKTDPTIYYLMDLEVYPGSRSQAGLMDRARLKGYVDQFNAAEAKWVAEHGPYPRIKDVEDAVPDEQAWQWMEENVPFFECPDPVIERSYYYRWWSYRKHIKRTPEGRVVTEFITPVRHAGKYNTISCALGHQIYEGRWSKDRSFLDEYILFWLRGRQGGPQQHLHKYSSWLADALYNRFLVTGNAAFVVDLLPDLVADYRQWEQARLLPDGLFWQYDVRDGMEESISGSRTSRNARPTINSYMYGNAVAIARIAHMAGRLDLAREFETRALQLKRLVEERLYDPNAEFFKVRLPDGRLSDAREAIGFIPWYFNLPAPGHERAWGQLLDPEGFRAPFGLTTAERRHPNFRSHGTGTCEWDGAVWPFATSQTLTAMANLIRNYQQEIVGPKEYLDFLRQYAASHQKDGQPYIGEYLDEKTGRWIKGDDPRGRHYNHSTFCDLVITGLVGLCPQPDQTIVVHPLVPEETWDWFAIEGLTYHGQDVAIY